MHKWADCAGVSNCSLMEEDGYFYVVSLTVYRWSTGAIEQTVYMQPSDIVPLPVREGYTFAGWATEEGGEVKYGVTTVTEKVLTMGQIPITQAKTHEVCFPDKSIDDVPDGTTLYAVWEKI